MQAAAILQIALQLLPLIDTGVKEFIIWLETLRVAAKAAGEWTADQDSNFKAALLAKTGDPAYLPDP